ncbi:MAG: transglutaminase family protein [Terrimicrobiaceae bacterium]
MRLLIRYHACFCYDKPASFSPHVVRLFPRRDKFLSVKQSQFSAAEGADIQYRADLFDNLVATCFFPERLSELPFQLELELELEEKNPFHFVVATHALDSPFSYRPDEARALAAYLGTKNPPLDVPEKISGKVTKPTVDVLVDMTEWIHKNIAYERREEGDPFLPEETLARASGSCRDMAVLQVELLRAQGFAARLVSGFLWEDPESTEDLRAENALHAWVETYIPGAGWISLDPTNGVFADHHRIPAAVGIEHAQIAPISGHYYGNENIPSTLTTSLEIQPMP